MDFDVNDPANLGRPIHWPLKDHLQAVNNLMNADCAKFALEIIDKVPAWYRDNPPKELLELRNKIYQQCYDQIQYATDDEEGNCTREFGESQWGTNYTHPRAEIITEEIVKANQRGQRPWIFDLGSSHGNLPLGLMRNGHGFTYRGAGMNWKIGKKLKEWVGDDIWRDFPRAGQERWLTLFEVIEHARYPDELIHSAHKIGIEFDQIFMSTPYGCLCGGLPEWKNRPIGHVTDWTTNEFLQFADKGFPGFSWTLYKSHSMVLHGRKIKA